MKLIEPYRYRTLLALVVLCFLCYCTEAKRKLTLHRNPNCEDYKVCDDIKNDLIYIEAVGPNDTLHFLWSTQGVPSSLVVRTDLGSSLNVNWNNLLSNSTNDSITFSEEPLYSLGLLLTKLWQYNDTEDKASMSGYNVQGFDFSEAQWRTENNTYNTSDECSVTFSSEHNTSSGLLSEGTFSLKLSSYGNDGRNDKLPRLMFNSDTSQLGIVLDKLLVTNEKSRYALEFMVMYSDKNGSGNGVAKKKSTTLDDEYTPGVFTIVELKTPSVCDSEKCSGFLFWKPIAYTSDSTTVAHSTDVKLSNIESNASLPFSIVKAFFGVYSFASTASWNVSLGMSNDSFYNNTQYTSWYFTVGLGSPPEDTPSLLLILTIGIGFGAPFICMVGGGTYMGFQRFLRKDDDLLLSRDSM